MTPHSSTPTLPPYLVPRPELESRLGSVATPVIAVCAGSGWGKTTGLAVWGRGRHTAWARLGPSAASTSGIVRAITTALRSARPDLTEGERLTLDVIAAGGGADDSAIEVQAADLAAAMGWVLAAPAALVLDEADHLAAGSPGAQLVDALLRQLPRGVQVAIASQHPTGIDLDALRARAAVTEIDTDALRLDAAGVDALVRGVLDDPGAALGPAVRRLTGGWPEAVRLVALSLVEIPADRRVVELEASGRGLVAVSAHLRTEVLPRLDPALVDVLTWGTVAPGLDPALCEALGAPPGAVEQLAARGLVQPGEDDGSPLVSPLVASTLQVRDEVAIRRAVVDALGAIDRPVAAMEVALASGDPDLVADVLLQHVSYLTRTAEMDVIVRAGALLDISRRTPELEVVIADAHLIRNEWTEALDCLRRAGAGSDALPAPVAWRLGLLLYLRWQIPEALAVFDAAAPIDPDDWEAGILRGGEAFARLLVGQHDAARDCASVALDIGARTQNPYVLCAAHTAMHALCSSEGDRTTAERHHRDARDYAQRYGAVLMEVRLASNHMSALVEQGRYAEAIAEAETCLPPADRAGHAASRLLVMTNLAEAHRRSGDLAAAEHHATEAIEIGRRGGIGLGVYPGIVLADVHRDRGDIEQACGRYAEAARAARSTGDAQAVVLALSGAARVTVDASAAHGYAGEAVVAATGTLRLPARLARAWTALRLGQVAEARADARWVLAEARRSGVTWAQAEAEEALAALAEDPGERDDRLAAAAAVHDRTGAALDALRVAHARARIAGDLVAVQAAATGRRAAGVHDRVVEVAGLDQVLAGLLDADGEAADDAAVRVFTFGGFALHRDGAPVATSDWGSRKPRDLLQILIARRGQRVARGVLLETLWPGEDPDRVGNRLSVALSTLRGVLDPDKRHAPDHFVAADPSAVWVDLRHLDVDLQRFHEAMGRARAAVAAGRPDAEERCEEAAGVYAGEFLADLPYEDWAIPAREEARAAHLESLRHLVALAGARGDHDAAVRASLRLLAEDPYDEDAYAELIGICSAAGRHGEAQRHYRQYVAQMRRLGIPPMPFPGVSGLRGIA
ncbi:BTAD domain-containing putative transcriptional regulator [Euzebya sp.]|uniref:BTAD domain-containing putative transcriptional regulator n=1 Tax=Euzebya sp. TaxID=1971409 RepID=UPI003511E636